MHSQPGERRPTVLLVLTAAVLLWLGASELAGEVTLRSQVRSEGPAADREAASLAGNIESVNLGGVIVVTPPGEGEKTPQRVWVSWDRLSRASLSAAIRLLPNDSERVRVDEIWRAAGRIERGDLSGAQGFFEDAFGEMLEQNSLVQTGPTQAAVALGTLRVRLASGSHTGSLLAYLQWVRVVRTSSSEIGGVWRWAGPGGGSGAAASSSKAGLDGIAWIGGGLAESAGASATIDRGTGLCPDLAPIFVADASTLALGSSDSLEEILRASAGDARGFDELIGWYRVALREQAGASFERPSVQKAPANAGVALVRDILIARVGQEAERDAARASLRGRLDRTKEDAGVPEWVEAWCRAGIGRSLCAEAEAGRRRQGVIELLHVPARYSRSTPGLAGTCLAHASVTLDQLADRDGAGRLARELARQYPNHVALNWEPIRAILSASPSGVESSASEQGGGR